MLKQPMPCPCQPEHQLLGCLLLERGEHRTQTTRALSNGKAPHQAVHHPLLLLLLLPAHPLRSLHPRWSVVLLAPVTSSVHRGRLPSSATR